VFGNKMLRKIYGANGVQISGQFTISHNEELHGSYRPAGIVRVVGFDGGHKKWMYNFGEVKK
jgi:hypothetical protein